jgi:hypothetical protein
MDWQFYLSGFAVGLAGVYLAARMRRAWRSTTSSGCPGGCCAKSTTTGDGKEKSTLIAPEQLVLRRRP